MMKWIKESAVCAGVLLFLFGVSGSAVSGSSRDGSISNEKRAVLASDTPVVIVNDTAITKREYERAMAAYLKQFRRSAFGSHKDVIDVNDRMKADVVEQLIDRQLLYEESSKYPVRDLDKKVDQRYEYFRSRFGSTEEYEHMMESEGLTEDAVRKMIAKEVSIADYVEQQISSKVSVSDEDVKQFYEENTARFSTPERLQASQVFVPVTEGASPTAQKVAREKAHSLHQRAVDGEELSGMAETDVDGSGAVRAMDMGYITRDQLLKSLSEVCFALQEGDVSEVVHTRFGYHFFKVYGRQAATQAELSDVEERIAEDLTRKAIERAVHDKIRELKDGAKISVIASHL